MIRSGVALPRDGNVRGEAYVCWRESAVALVVPLLDELRIAVDPVLRTSALHFGNGSAGSKIVPGRSVSWTDCDACGQ